MTRPWTRVTARVGVIAAVALAVVVLTGLVAPSGVGAATAADSQTDAGSLADPDPLGSGSVDPDAVLLRVALESDGNASWTVEYRTRLDDQNTTDAWESVQADIQENASAFTTQFGDGMRRTARAAENETDREMRILDVSVTAEKRQLPQEYGVIAYSFQWTNFSAVESDRLRAGDALAGLFLDEETTLVFAWPEGYASSDVAPEPDDSSARSVSWIGPLDFGPDQPSLVVAPEPTPTPTPTATPTATTTTDGSDTTTTVGSGEAPTDGGGETPTDGGGGTPADGTATTASGPATTTGGGGDGGDGAGREGDSEFVLPLFIGAIVLVLGAILLSRVVGDEGLLDEQPFETSGDADGDPAADGEATGTDGNGDAAAAAAGGAAAAAGGEDDESEPPEELLSNEEKVLKLLDENGGRIKQQQIAGEFDWTDAKTSQVVGSLRDDDEVETFRIGRENVVTFPDEEL